jgi:hypothetical protein
MLRGISGVSALVSHPELLLEVGAPSTFPFPGGEAATVLSSVICYREYRPLAGAYQSQALSALCDAVQVKETSGRYGLWIDELPGTRRIGGGQMQCHAGRSPPR